METLENYLANSKSESFSPGAYYDQYGDSLFFFFRGDDYFAERVDKLLTIYRDFKSRDIVGCQVKSVRCMLEKLGRFGVSLADDQIDIRMIFLAYVAAEKPTEDAFIDELNREAEKVNARIPARELVAA